MSTEIDDDTDCSIWASREENRVVPPAGAISVRNLPDPSEYDGLLEGGDILQDYEARAEVMEELHEDWREVALEWSRRMDQLFAQIVVLERTLRDQGAAPPVDEFEDVTSQTIGFYVASIFGFAQGSWSLGKFVMERVRDKKTIGVGTQAPSVRSASSNASYSSSASARSSASSARSAGSARSASSLARGMNASKATRWKSVARGAGKATMGLATVASLVVVAVDVANRNKSLNEAIPRFHAWLFGRDGNGNPIAEPDITTEEITVGGAAGRIIEMQRAVAEIHDAIRTLANLEGVATQNPDGSDRDMNLVYCETRQAVGDNIYDASQVMAATRVATRMLCIDKWTDGVSYTDGQIAGVTGLSAFEIGALRTRVDGDDSLCAGIAPASGGA
jgi:hypothetical protein